MFYRRNSRAEVCLTLRRLFVPACHHKCGAIHQAMGAMKRLASKQKKEEDNEPEGKVQTPKPAKSPKPSTDSGATDTKESKKDAPAAGGKSEQKDVTLHTNAI